jgi:hypothetical protein
VETKDKLPQRGDAKCPHVAKCLKADLLQRVADRDVFRRFLRNVVTGALFSSPGKEKWPMMMRKSG